MLKKIKQILKKKRKRKIESLTKKYKKIVEFVDKAYVIILVGKKVNNIL